LRPTALPPAIVSWPRHRPLDSHQAQIDAIYIRSRSTRHPPHQPSVPLPHAPSTLQLTTTPVRPTVPRTPLCPPHAQLPSLTVSPLSLPAPVSSTPPLALSHLHPPTHLHPHVPLPVTSHHSTLTLDTPNPHHPFTTTHHHHITLNTTCPFIHHPSLTHPPPHRPLPHTPSSITTSPPPHPHLLRSTPFWRSRKCWYGRPINRKPARDAGYGPHPANREMLQQGAATAACRHSGEVPQYVPWQ